MILYVMRVLKMYILSRLEKLKVKNPLGTLWLVYSLVSNLLSLLTLQVIKTEKIGKEALHAVIWLHPPQIFLL